MLFKLFRKTPARKCEMVVLTEPEFNFLAKGVHSGGLVGAWSTDADALDLAASLVSKDCIYPAGHLPVMGKAYVAWNMTPKGVDAALGGFAPAPGWFPFKQPESL